jgi:hypothetical protein
MEVRQVRTMHCGGLRFTELQTLVRFRSDGTRIGRTVRDNVETISPVAVSCTGRADKPGADSSISHQITTPSIPCGRDRQPDVSRIYDDSSDGGVKTKISAVSLTKVGDRADLAGYLLFRVFPHTA